MPRGRKPTGQPRLRAAHTHVEPWVRELLAVWAAEDGVTVSAWMRGLVTAHVEARACLLGMQVAA